MHLVCLLAQPIFEGIDSPKGTLGTPHNSAATCDPKLASAASPAIDAAHQGLVGIANSMHQAASLTPLHPCGSIASPADPAIPLTLLPSLAMTG
jgi:hypothetical protein